MTTREPERDTLQDLLAPEPRGRRGVAHETWRSRLVDVVVEVVASEGVAAVSFAAIAARAGTSKSTVAYHFDSGEELLATTLRTVYARAARAVTEAVVAAPPGPDQLRAYIEAGLAHLRTHRFDMVALLALRVGPSAPVRDLGARIAIAVVDALAELVDAVRPASAAGNGPGRGRPGSTLPAREVALALRGAIDAAAVVVNRDPDAVDLESYARTLIALHVPDPPPRPR